MNPSLRTLWPVLGMAILFAGCQSDPAAQQPERRSVQPADFLAAEPVPITPTPPSRIPVSEPTAAASEASASPTDPLTLLDQQGNPIRLVSDAMVGQVNGRALYASQVIEPIDPQLLKLGQTLPRPEFRRRSQELVAATLNQIVTDALILGEAERSLSEQERYGLLELLRLEREKLLRVFGEGARSVAERNLQQERGRSLDEMVEDRRAQLVVQRYLQQKLLPRINVTRKDIRRYYLENEAEFNPPSTRTLRLIVAANESAAKEIESRLAAGDPFVEIASSKANRYRPEQSGLFVENAKGDKVFGDERDAAFASLSAGQHTPRIDRDGRAYWVYVESFAPGQPISLQEAQTGIEARLRQVQFQKLSAQYREELFRRGSFGDVDTMTDAVMDVVMSRYAPL